MENIVSNWYQSLIDDCSAIIAEGEFNARWTLIECYHSLGQRILQEHENFEKGGIYGQQIVERVAKSLSRSPRSIYYAVKFAKNYKTVGDAPEGKEITWTKLVRKYLTDEKQGSPKDIVGDNYPHFHRCSRCGLWETEADKKYLCKCGEL